MKKLFTLIVVAALAASMGNRAQAQIFDLDAATDFYLIWLDESTEQYYEITDRIVKDYRPNGDYGQNVGERFIDIWDNTYTFGEVAGKGAMDQIGGFLNFDFAALGQYPWGGGGFILYELPGTTLPYLIDYTGITDDYRFHMAVKSTMEKANRIRIAGGGKINDQNISVADDDKSALFIVGVGDHVYEDPALPNLTPGFKANEWYSIDVPVSQLKEDMGWNNRSAFRGYYFTYEFGNTANNLSIDAIFFYRPIGNGIVNPQVNNKLNVFITNQTVEALNATAPVEIYNLAGIKVKSFEKPIFGVEELNKGAYIIKSGSAVAKVLIK